MVRMSRLRHAAALPLFVIATVGLLATETAAGQEPAASGAPVSVTRVKEALNRTPMQSLRFDARMPVPVATFKVTVTQRIFVVPIMDSLRKEFELTPLQRQSAEWSSKCCGISIAALTEGLERALRRREERRVRERVARELAEVIAAADK
jgi:hypothetical protein